MTKIHHCTCRINLSGQNCHIVNYDQFNTVTWPEVQVLMALHGDENVMDVVPVMIDETSPSAEKERLANRYGNRIVEQCFPGRAFRMQLMMTDDDQLPRVEDVQAQVTDAEVAALAAQPATFSTGRNRKPHEAGKEA
ncbi:hypothetical protein [Bradyrhizobium japonicum]|uniref:hypothetical protein n=1 Tax=Bradyrhizobium japonicum TaxID=375 RepID=UPI00200CB264|nr:hypothetical protein [Bradyrhizobium japonicum]UQD96102.1 hypothetical protein JEY30_31665 [Bradyrhizobium japonicum]